MSGVKGKSGKKKTPDKMKVIKGTAQPCRLSGDTGLAASKTLPEAPDYLSDHAKKLYERMGQNFLHLQILNVYNIEMFAMLICELSNYMQLQKQINEEGFTISSSKKVIENEHVTINNITTAINPKLRIAKSIFANVRSLATEFGMTPNSFVNIATNMMREKPKDDYESFLNG